MKLIDRLILRATQATGDLVLTVVFLEEAGNKEWIVKADLWNGKSGIRSISDRITGKFSSRDKADAFIEELLSKYPPNRNVAIIEDDGMGLDPEEV